MLSEKRAYCLYRVSTKGQVDKNDIPMQRIECREFCKRMGWQIVKEISEKGVSGFKVSADNRDAIQEIKRDAERKLFEVLVVFMFDRLGRRDDETPFVVQWFVKHGIEVWSTQEGEQRLDSHVDKLLNYIRYWQASGESEKTSVRIQTKHAQMVQEGIYRGGYVPYGYTLVNQGRQNKKGHTVYDIAIDETEAEIVRILFRKVVQEGYGTHRLANWLNNNGVPTKRKSTHWRATTLRALLGNQAYTGRMKFGDILGIQRALVNRGKPKGTTAQ